MRREGKEGGEEEGGGVGSREVDNVGGGGRCAGCVFFSTFFGGCGKNYIIFLSSA